MNKLLLLFLAGFFAISCKPAAPAAEDNTATVADTSATTVSNIPGLTRLWDTEKTLTTSESVLYDATNQVLYVSCINGVPPDKKDNDGYIARVSLDGKILDAKWVKGLSGPKGMGQAGNTLYVTDIDRLVAIDIPSGKISNTWKVDGASFLNDVFVTADGTVYFTDSNTSKIHSLAQGKINTVVSDTILGGTNGILVEGNIMYVAGMMSGKVFRIDISTGKIEELAAGIPNGDGVERYGDALMVSNWAGQVYYVAPDGETTMLLDSQEAKLNAADIEVIADKNLLLVPTFFGNNVTAYQLIKN